MEYKWESVGDQNECIRKVCYLGPYLLEHVEDHWKEIFRRDGSKRNALMMASHIYLWDDENKIPELIKTLEPIEYESGESWKPLEDWYAMNVLVEKLFTGDSDEVI